MEEKSEKILINSLLKSDKYYTNEDLRMNTKLGILFNKKELEEFLNYKDNYKSKRKHILNLKTFNSNYIYYYESYELVNKLADYYDYFCDEIVDEKDILLYDDKEVILSQLSSELEGTLKTEGVNTTRKHIINIVNTSNIENKNDQIILNMYFGYKFIEKKTGVYKRKLIEFV